MTSSSGLTTGARLSDADIGLRRIHDRSAGGRALAAKLASLRDDAPMVLGIPGGGVPVAAEIACALGADLDVLVVQPVRSPVARDHVIGLLAEGAPPILDAEAVAEERLTEEDVAQSVLRAGQTLRVRSHRYRDGRPLPDLTGRTVILVDDGILSGRTMRAALAARAHFQPRRIVVAAPVAAAMVARLLRSEADDVVVAKLCADLRQVADAYDDFHPLADIEVLGEIARGRATVLAQADIVVTDVDVPMPSGPRPGTVRLSRGNRGFIVVPGSGERERAAATALLDDDLGSLLVDIGDEPEGRASRLVAAVDWAFGSSGARGLPVGLLVPGSDLALAREAAAARPGMIGAVVICGVSHELATPTAAPTLPLPEGSGTIARAAQFFAKHLARSRLALDGGRR